MVVVFSARMNKWNKYWIKQERVFVVTNKNVYNFHKKSNSLAINFLIIRSSAYYWDQLTCGIDEISP